MADLRRFIAATGLVVYGCLHAGDAPARDILIAAPVSLAEVVRQLSEDFTAKTQVKVRASTAATSAVVRQVLHGAPFDVVITADIESMDRVDGAGLLAPDTRRPFIGNRLALIVPQVAPQKLGARAISGQDVILKEPHDLLNAQIKRVVLAEEAVPAGHYARLFLATTSLLEGVRPKIVRAPHVRAALALVARGAVDAGFVYATDVLVASDQVRVVYTTEDGASAAIRYEAAVLKASQHHQDGVAFVSYLRSPDAQALLQQRGFRPL